MEFDFKKVRSAMISACVGPTDLSKKAGISYATVAKVSTKNATVTTTTAGKLAKALGVSWKDLIKD